MGAERQLALSHWQPGTAGGAAAPCRSTWMLSLGSLGDAWINGDVL